MMQGAGLNHNCSPLSGSLDKRGACPHSEIENPRPLHTARIVLPFSMARICKHGVGDGHESGVEARVDHDTDLTAWYGIDACSYRCNE